MSPANHAMQNTYTSPEIEEARQTRSMLWSKAVRGEIGVEALYRALAQLREACGDDLYPRQVLGRR